jgi:hypothetical protein
MLVPGHAGGFLRKVGLLFGPIGDLCGPLGPLPGQFRLRA